MIPDKVAIIICIFTISNPLRKTARAAPKQENISQIEHPISRLVEGTESSPTQISMIFAPAKKSIIAEGILTNKDH